MLPGKLSSKVKESGSIRIPPKVNGEKRILSADIALMASNKHKNDATAVWVDQMLPTKAGRYSNSIVYGNAYEGLRTEDQALVIRRLFDEYQCDYLVLDTNGKLMPILVVISNLKRERKRESCNANPSGRLRSKA